MNIKALVIYIIVSCIVNIACAQQSGKVVQVKINKLLNARPVTTLTKGKLVSWTKGIDGGGTGDGYLTISAALYNGDKNAHALPDNPLIPASASHPSILLHYKNDGAGNQTYNLAGEGGGEFDVPHKKYNNLYLSLTSAEGPSKLHITLLYADGSETKDYTLPDYYADIAAGDNDLSYALHDLAKWGPKNNMTEKDHHNIDVLRINSNPGRVLKTVFIKKEKEGYLVFWAATGIVAD